MLAPPTGPPLAMWPWGALPVMVTELLRACSPAAPFKVLRAIAGGTETVGMAGVMLGRPFTGGVADLPFWLEEAEDPTTTGGWEPAAINGVAVGFLDAPAAEAYDGAEEAEGVVAEIWGC